MLKHNMNWHAIILIAMVAIAQRLFVGFVLPRSNNMRKPIDFLRD